MMWQNSPYGFGYGDGYGMMSGGYWLGMGLHGLFWILLVVAIAIAVVWTVRALGRPNHHLRHDGEPGARAILDARYARGEIDRDDYLARKKDMAD